MSTLRRALSECGVLLRDHWRVPLIATLAAFAVLVGLVMTTAPPLWGMGTDGAVVLHWFRVAAGLVFVPMVMPRCDGRLPAG